MVVGRFRFGTTFVLSHLSTLYLFTINFTITQSHDVGEDDDDGYGICYQYCKNT